MCYDMCSFHSFVIVSTKNLNARVTFLKTLFLCVSFPQDTKRQTQKCGTMKKTVRIFIFPMKNLKLIFVDICVRIDGDDNDESNLLHNPHGLKC